MICKKQYAIENGRFSIDKLGIEKMLIQYFVACTDVL